MKYFPKEKQKLINDVCELMHQGESLRASCQKYKIPVSTFMKWVENDDEVSEQYARARGVLIDYHTNEIIELADKLENDAARSRVQVDTRKWILSKLMPKTFGDKVTNELTGELNINRIERRIVNASNTDS